MTHMFSIRIQTLATRAALTAVMITTPACTREKERDAKAGVEQSKSSDPGSPTGNARGTRGHEPKSGAKDSGRKDGESKGGGPGRGRGPVAVQVTAVAVTVTPRPVEAVAALSGRTQVEVFSKVTGRITWMGPREGQPVKVGETLFRVDRSDPGESYLNAPVVSPIAGWVGRWRVLNLGEQITPADPVITIVDDRELKAVAFLPAADWLEIAPDTKVTVTAGEETRDGRIETIARAADTSSGRGSVTVIINNSSRNWRGGMYARLAFSVSPRPRMLLKTSAITVTDQGAFVYVVDGENAKRTPIKFSLVNADTVEVLEGLTAGAQVVTAGANLVSNNSPVRIVTAEEGKQHERRR